MNDKPIAAGKSSFEVVDSAAVLAELELDQGPVMADIACGIGNYSLAAARKMAPGGKIHAFDLWREGIEELNRRIVAEGVTNLTAAVADASKHIPLADDSVDVCLIATALHDLIEDHTGEGAVREIARVLKPGGRLVIVEFKKVEGSPGPPLHIRLSPGQLDEFVEPFGFEKQHTTDAGPHTYLTKYRLH
ncbi:MAG: class I SAM-dependent methyltransferase [Actinobacteria bacterium]|nr:class I SAM-dependent methyltransferase [Actinomycetota bacterium]MCL5883663.1 class I SAM-dependent methyltransferase [Actinomycetota bacterium]